MQPSLYICGKEINTMKTKRIFGILLLFLSIISFASCAKEEFDFDSVETKESTVVEGTIISSGGLPLANVEVKVDYHEGKWLAYSKTRHKAETKTDKYGKYRLFFSVKDDELETEKDKEVGVSKNYSLIFNLLHLNTKEYIIPSDMTPTITSVDPPIAVAAEKADTKIDFFISSFERSETYTENLYIPQKRYIQVTLKGFIPSQGDYFEVESAFPYGWESADHYVFPNTNYHYGKVGHYMFALYDAEERTYQVPCALNENNIITLIRKKNGIYTTEEHPLFVTKDTPTSLTFEY